MGSRVFWMLFQTQSEADRHLKHNSLTPAHKRMEFHGYTREQARKTDKTEKFNAPGAVRDPRH